MKTAVEKIEIYIKILRISQDNILSLSSEILDFLGKLNTEDINTNIESVAELFCATVSHLEVADLKKMEIEIRIIDAYNNIKNMRDIKESGIESNCSYIMVIVFLKKLNNMVDNELDLSSITADMQNQFEELSENLENIKTIFKVKENKKEIFPLGKLLASVISADRFKINVLDIQTLNTLLLALEVFNTAEYHNEKDQLKRLIDECNIKCLTYLEKDTVKRFDEQSWKMNFKKNGVLILADIISKTILIRHEDRSYFSNLPECEMVNIKDEKNREGKIIASFYEYVYNDDEKFLSLDKILLSENREWKLNLLKIIYNNKNYNSFFSDAFLESGDTIRLVNPFTFNDRIIVRGSQEEATLASSVQSVTDECMTNYWLELFIHKGLNCASIGLLCNLLTIEDVDVSILCGKLESDKSYQSQIIRNWIFASTNSYRSLVTIQDKYFKSLKYFQSFDEMKKTKFLRLYLYPVQFDDLIIETLLLNEYGNDYSINCEFKKAKYLLSFHGEQEGISVADTKIGINNVIYGEHEFENNEEIYTIKVDNDKWLVNRVVHNLGIVESKINSENKKLLRFETLSIFAESQIGLVQSCMVLQEKGLLDQHNISVSFTSMVKFRLANNIVLYKINTQEKWGAFLEILSRHEKTRFENVVNLVNLNSEGVLYVPKENQESDSVLTSITNEYLRKNSTRNIDLYISEIVFKNSKYQLRGKEIKEIVIIFDTLQTGTSTKRTLSFYFENYGMYSFENHLNRTMNYYSEKKPVNLKTIMLTNNASLTICFINGTKSGEVEIKKYCDEKGIIVTVKCDQYIESYVDDSLISMCLDLYDKCYMKVGQFPIIREFNQPKLNLFPPDMLDPEHVFALFVKKSEHKKY